jgi:hypothetical protein
VQLISCCRMSQGESSKGIFQVRNCSIAGGRYSIPSHSLRVLLFHPFHNIHWVAPTRVWRNILTEWRFKHSREMKETPSNENVFQIIGLEPNLECLGWKAESSTRGGKVYIEGRETTRKCTPPNSLRLFHVVPTYQRLLMDIKHEPPGRRTLPISLKTSNGLFR